MAPLNPDNAPLHDDTTPATRGAHRRIRDGFYFLHQPADALHVFPKISAVSHKAPRKNVVVILSGVADSLANPLRSRRTPTLFLPRP